MEKILVYIFDGMADFEITLLTHLLGAQFGEELMVISNEDKMIFSKSGMMYKAHKSISEVDYMDVKGIIIPGGWNENITDELLKLIQNIHRNNKLLAAICAGPVALARAGVLSGHQYTTSIIEWQIKHKDFFRFDDPFPREGFVNERVVVDQNIITAKVTAFIDFSVEVCDYLKHFKDNEEKRKLMEQLKS